MSVRSLASQKTKQNTCFLIMLFAPEVRPPRLQPTNLATTCHHHLPNTSFLGSKGRYQVIRSNFRNQNRSTNHQGRATNQPKQQPTTQQPTNQPTEHGEMTTNNQQQPTNQSSNRPTDQPSNQYQGSPNPRTKNRSSEWPGEMCGAPE